MSFDLVNAQEISQEGSVQQLEMAQCVKNGEATTVIYDRGYFQRYDVTTAEDMLRRIPGMMTLLDDTEENQQERGLGSSGEQILINGKRIAGKSTQIVTSLQRIQASSVNCIQLIRGTSSETNVQSEGVLVNLIIGNDESNSRNTSWQFINKLNDKGWFDVAGIVSHSGKWNDLDYLVSFERDVWSRHSLRTQRYTNRSREEFYHFSDGSIQQNRLSDDFRDYNKYAINTNLAYEFDNDDTFLLNGFLQQLTINVTENIQFTAFNADGTLNRPGIDLKTSVPEQLAWEIGTEYRKKIADGDLNLIFIYTHTKNEPTNFRNEIVGNVTSEINRIEEEKIPTEGIIRGSYSWPITSSMALEVGAEGSLNKLDQTFNAFFDLDNNGSVEPLPTLNTEVEELREELFIIHNWKINDRLALESSIVAEASNVSNNFDSAPDQDYFFIKPRADLRYDLTSSDQIQIKIERTVEQLVLNLFVPTFDSNDTEVDAGNLGLTPQTAWEFEARYDRRLANDNGTIDIRTFYYDIQDFTDKRIIGFDNNDPINGAPISASGSIGDASHYGVEVKVSTRLSFINLPEVVVDVRYLRQESNVTDPFSGKNRIFERPWLFDFGFRHDVTNWGMSYGMNIEKFGGKFVQRDLNFSSLFTIDTLLDIFIEKELFSGISVRMEGRGLLPSKQGRDRTVFAVNNNAGVVNRTVLRTESFEETRDRRFLISFRGAF